MSLSDSTLGPYTVLEKIGAGGMGEVYRAHDTRLGRDVAIKALPDAFARDPERLSRFEREARLLATLSHPNIAAIYGLEEVAGDRYLVLEYIEGPTLAERLAQGRIPLDEAIDICRQIAAGVEAAHESGVIHRDLKPGNVKITPDGKVKVLDFGLAKSASGGDGSDFHISHSPTLAHAATGAGVILGTAAYMSPEQARGRVVDRRTDIWSFGCVLYECLTGRQLYDGETVSDLIARILEREPDWSALPANVPPRVRELLRRCLRKDPKERLRDIGDARLELGEAFTDPPAAVAAVMTPVRRRRFGWEIGAAALVAVLATALAGFALVRARGDAPEMGTLRVSVQAPDGVEVSQEVPDITISPDGTTLAFVGQDSSGTRRLWLRPLSSATARAMPGTEGAAIPFWSPDSRNIAFFAGGELRRTAVAVQGVQAICPAPNPRGGAWSPNDVIVFGPAASGPLMQVPASGGAPKPATTLDAAKGETAHRFPSFLPDGRRFLYVALPGRANETETRVGSLDSPEPGPVVLSANSTAVYAGSGYLLFNRQGTVLAQAFDAGELRLDGTPHPIRDLVDATASYSGSPVLMTSRDGVLVQRELRSTDTRVEFLDRAGQARGALALPPGTYTSPRFSPDGSRLIFNFNKLGLSVSPLVMADAARNISSRFTVDGTFDTDGVWTSDGRRVFYGSDRGGGRSLYAKNADGSGAETLVADVPNLFNDPTDITPDGRTIIYRSLSGETSEDIWTVPVDGRGEPKPLIQTRFNEMDAVVSPDGRWIAYRSDESGRFEIYVQSFPSLDRKYRVSDAGANPLVNTTASWARWRSDGRELYFIGGDGQTIMVSATECGEAFGFETPRPLLRLPRGFVDADISPDGQRIAVCMPTGVQGRSVINVVMNWEQEIEGAE
jgi:Tol biopolymer transport system component